MSVQKKRNYDVLINGQGFVFHRQPEVPARTMDRVTVYENRFSQGDRTFTDFTVYWFWAQQDFSLGIKTLPFWKDDAQFYRSSNVNVFFPGEIRLMQKPSNTYNLNTYSGGVTESRVTAALQMNYSGTQYVLLGTGGAAVEPFVVNTSNHFSSTATSVWGDATSNAIQDIIEYKNEAYAICTGSTAKPLWGQFGNEVVTRIAATPVSIVEPTAVGASDTDIFLACAITSSGVKKIYNSVSASGSLQNNFTQVGTDLPAGYVPRDIIAIGRKGYVLLEQGVGGNIEFKVYDAAANTQSSIWVWRNYTWGVAERYQGRSLSRPYGTKIYILLANMGVPGMQGTNVIELWQYDTATGIMTRVYQDLRGLLTQSTGFTFKSDKYYFDNAILDPLTNAISGGQIDINGTTGIAYPMESLSGDLYSIINLADNVTDANVYRHSNVASNFYTTGTIDTSKFFAFPTIDKQFYFVDIVFDPLQAGEAIAVSYSIDGGTSYTSIGSASYTADGGVVTRKTIYLSTPVNNQNMMLRFTLTAGTSNATTPNLRSYSVAYLPHYAYKNQWHLKLKVQAKVQLKNKYNIEPKESDELRNMLMQSYYLGNAVVFQDVDYLECTLAGSLTAIATTIPTNEDLDDWPEQGQIHIGSEWIFYTGKGKRSFLNCVRAARFSNASAASDGDPINNAYQVIITDFTDSLVLSEDPASQEWIVALTLREI